MRMEMGEGILREEMNVLMVKVKPTRVRERGCANLLAIGAMLQ